MIAAKEIFEVLEGDGMKLFTTTEAKKLNLINGQDMLIDTFCDFIGWKNN